MDTIDDMQQRSDDSLLSFQWPAGDITAFLARLSLDSEAINHYIRAFEYDYQTGTAYINVIDECELPYQIRGSLAEYIKTVLARCRAAPACPASRIKIARIKDFAPHDVKHGDELFKRVDASFGRSAAPLPFFVCEVF